MSPQLNQFLVDLGAALRSRILEMDPPKRGRRPNTKKICEALESSKKVIDQRFGGPVMHRYRGRAPNLQPSYSSKPQKSLEYLWDFSFSRFAIPQAIEKSGTAKITNNKYELLLVAESELGTADEVCRDLLKLLEARCRVRCLIYKRPQRSSSVRALHERMIRVMHNHAHFQPRREVWLLVGLAWAQGPLTCELHTLNARGTRVVPVKSPGTA